MADDRRVKPDWQAELERQLGLPPDFDVSPAELELIFRFIGDARELGIFEPLKQVFAALFLRKDPKSPPVSHVADLTRPPMSQRRSRRRARSRPEAISRVQ